MPRLDTPRARVPRGAVALGGPLVRGLPEQLPGRVAGARHHRRRPVGRAPRPAGHAVAGHAGEVRAAVSAPYLDVLAAGALTTVQDRGRRGRGPPRRPARGGARRTGGRAGQPRGRQRRRRRGAGGDPRAGSCCGPAPGAGWRSPAPRARSPSRAPPSPTGRRCGSRRAACSRSGARCTAYGPTSRSRAGSTCRRCSARAPPTPSPASARPRSRPGDRLPLGVAAAPPAHHDAPHPARPGPLRLLPGPRADWCEPDVLRAARRGAVRRAGRLQPRGPAAAGALPGAGPRRGAAQRGHRAGRGAGAAGRTAGRVPGRPPADRRLPGRGGRRRPTTSGAARSCGPASRCGSPRLRVRSARG